MSERGVRVEMHPAGLAQRVREAGQAARLGAVRLDQVAYLLVPQPGIVQAAVQVALPIAAEAQLAWVLVRGVPGVPVRRVPSPGLPPAWRWTGCEGRRVTRAGLAAGPLKRAGLARLMTGLSCSFRMRRRDEVSRKWMRCGRSFPPADKRSSAAG